MPLIMMTGYPSSGKSTRALELKQLFETKLAEPAQQHRRLTVQIIDDASLGVTHDAYSKPSAEKIARGALLSAVERLVSRETIVIADTPNYIKGLRYQLYCVSREVSTTQCVVHCAISVDAARRINQARADGYSDTLFEELVMRYEEPNPAAKWDSPLFTVIQHDPADQLPFDAIWDALVEQRAPPPNFATAMKPVSETNYLFELDKMTLDIINALLESQKSGVPMSEVVVPGTKDKVRMPGRNLTLSELRRYRMQFTKLNRQVPLKIDKISTLFVNYLNINL
ncbi:kti12, chromatin associated [Coemansia aciculifera]|uniref:Kti12, chromatin associated n=1 Tax=Coemansia aciculifera TaxID=417176 RepID=A0A9W8M2N8_9FUNG|nr:kti12, chromatin associated [Coemansia aciculifera]KAJ2870550.1 kti12, chromatin associated [Coemansia aciculifera]KAJ2881795.1 kti12, chromatin associated [Coemansia aciculifera]